MKHKNVKIVLITFIVFIIGLYLFFVELSKSKIYNLGTIKVTGISNYKITFTQIYNDGEQRSSINADLKFKNKYIKGFVTWSLDFDEIELYHYKAKCKDSIIYILEDSRMIDYYDLKKRKNSFDSINSYLHKIDKEIK